jgi:adenosylcobinamide kinase/adenosylcobinamide-phosphate guanylyltransferase
MLILLTGGVKSGKSGRALELAREEFAFPAVFIATAEVLDEEMRARITRHQEERAGLGFTTVEEPLEIDRALSGAGDSVLLDCVPMWINNLMYYKREGDFASILGRFLDGLFPDGLCRNCIIVTNETGLGNIPFDAETRRYNLLLAEANRLIAARAERVEFMVSGIPLRVK